jgi:hypothetical protein
LFAKPTCSTCGTEDVNIPKLALAKAQIAKTLESVKKQTKEIKDILKHRDAPPPVDFLDPIEHIAGSTAIVVGANAMENKIDESELPFADYGSLPAKAKNISGDGTIPGIHPPAYADPRVMSPALAAAPVQFSDPAIFGTFGVTDDISPTFSTTSSSRISKTNAKIVSDVSQEGFENGGIVMNGKVVTAARQLPTYQLRGVVPHHTSLPQRSLDEPPATVEDLVNDGIFDGLQGYPINEKLDLLTPPGATTPFSEFCAINYG